MEMISPRFGLNTVMQVNMGEGKSSVIVPIAAAILADGHRLVRVLVPKALTSQMMYLLVDRLGGLANRPVYRFPFSRSGRWGLANLQGKMSQCMEEHGIVLVQPEHVLSLKLTSVEKRLSKHEFSVPSLKLHKSIDHDVVVSALKFVSMMITGSTTFRLADHLRIVERQLSR